MRKSLLILFLLVYFLGYGQHPYFYRLNHENGLPSNEVYTVQQDKEHYIWIGCDAGLLKYNGFYFDIIDQPGGNRSSISNVQIANGNRVWCQNFSGQIFTMDIAGSALKLAFDASPYCRNFPGYSLDNSGNAWVMTDSLLFKVDKYGNYRQMHSASGLNMPSREFATIATGKNGYIYVIDFQGKLIALDQNGAIRRSSQLPCEPGHRYQLYQSREEVILIIEYVKGGGLNYKIYRVDGKGEHIIDTWRNRINGKILDYTVNGTVHYCSTDNGVISLDMFEPDRSPNYLFGGKKISKVFRDKEGLTWFTSLQDGVYVVPSGDVLMVTEGDGKLKDLNFSALAIKNEETITVGNYSGELYNVNVRNRQLTPATESGRSLRAVRKIIWQGDMLYVARGDFQIFKNGQLIESIPELRNTRDFCFLGDTIFYTASDRTGYCYKSDGKWKNKPIRSKGGRKVAVSNGAVYILFSDGFYEWKANKIREIRFKGKPLLAHTLVGTNDRLFIANFESGLLEYTNGKFKTDYLNKNNVRGKDILDFFTSKTHDLIATRDGLTVVDKVGDKLSFINEYDGLGIKEITAALVLKGKIYLATISGLFELPVAPSSKNKIPPTLNISTVKVNGAVVSNKDQINLTYDDYELTFKLSGVSLRSKGNYKRKYRMLGLTEKWTTIEASQDQVTYTSLPSGQYTFEVVSMNEDGVESPVVRKTIIVHSPVWEKWWFMTLILIVSLGTMYFVFRWRLLKIRKQAKLKQDITAAQLTAIKAQMNPHFLFNTMNSLQDLILKQDFKSTNYYLSKYSTLMRMILTNSERTEVDISEELTMLELYLQLEQLRFGSEFSYELICSDELKDGAVNVPPMIIQPFVENAIKHGLMHKLGEKKLTIEFYSDKDSVYCDIFDNGIGRKRSKEINDRQRKNHVSFSTSATDERLRLLEDYYGKPFDLEIHDLEVDGAATGTKVIIRFPRNQNHS